MKFDVILENTGGELDRKQFEVADDAEDVSAEVDDKVSCAIDDWILSVGDTIRVVEVAP